MALTPSQLRATMAQIEQNYQAKGKEIEGYLNEYTRLLREETDNAIPTAEANKNMKAAEKAGDQELAARYRAEWQAGVARGQNIRAQQDANQATVRNLAQEQNKIRDQLDAARDQLDGRSSTPASDTVANSNVQSEPAPVDTRPTAADFSVRPIQVPQVQPDGSVKLGTEYIVTNNVRGVDVGAFNTQAEAQAFIVSQSVPAPDPPVQEATPVAGGTTATPAAATPSATAPAAVPADGTPAAAAAPAATAASPTPVTPQTVNPVAYDDDGNLMPGFELDENNNPVFVGKGTPPTVYTPTPVPPSKAGPVGTPYDDDGNLNPGWTLDENNNPVYVGGNFVEPATAASAAASREAATKAKAKQQATFQARYKQPGNQDWRVRLSLGPNANYLYNAGTPRGSSAGILAPLAATDGVIFPYTPNITTNYSANYEQYDLVHSNYRGVYYKNSRVGDISVRGMFTAQDTNEANYLLAVIHFFRSATKMFYGQDAERGTPPPICLLNGFGSYQFSDHPVVITSFNYTIPNDVDYIRAVNPNNYGSNLLNRRAAVASNPGGSSIAGLNRLLNAGQRVLRKGALPAKPAPGSVNQSVNNTAGATYVPTKMEIDITLIPVQTRSQVSKQFSLKDFANGQGLKGGLW